MPTACLDTNVLLYAAIGRKDETDKWRIALALLERGDVSLPAQALAEFYAIATGPKYRLDHATANFWMERLVLYPTTELDRALVLEGIALSQRYRISYWDGAILAACLRCLADMLFSEDMNHNQVYGAVRVINPFR
jgi:predicted nucleic acid-binding protein